MLKRILYYEFMGCRSNKVLVKIKQTRSKLLHRVFKNFINTHDNKHH